MAFCNHCGTPIGEDWRFCQACGRPITGQAGTAAVSDTLQAWMIPAAVGGAALVVLLLVWMLLFRPSDPVAAPVTTTTTTAVVPVSIPETTTTVVETTTTVAQTTTTQPRTFADIFAETGDGVVRIEVVSCDGGGLGSGFLVGDSLVVTAAHVVDEAVTIGVTTGDTTTTGLVVGIDQLSDIAVVSLESPLPGYPFVFASEAPSVGSPIIVLGYPRGEPLSLSQGTISGLDREIEGYGATRLIQTDAAINFGNSGGPLIDAEGQVVGVVTSKYFDSEGLAYAIPGLVAANRTAEWGNRASVLPEYECEDAIGPGAESGTVAIEGVDISEVEDTFVAYFDGINTGDFFNAWMQLSPRVRDTVPFEEFMAGTLTSYDFGFVAHSYVVEDADTRTVWLSFASIQSPDIGPRGESCTLWSLDYTMEWVSGDWYIDRAAGHDEGEASGPCP